SAACAGTPRAPSTAPCARGAPPPAGARPAIRPPGGSDGRRRGSMPAGGDTMGQRRARVRGGLGPIGVLIGAIAVAAGARADGVASIPVGPNALGPCTGGGPVIETSDHLFRGQFPRA